MPAPGARIPLIERLFSRVLVQPNDCWLWTGALTRKGYGAIGEGGKRGRTLQVHVVAYQLLVGPVPKGLELDHLCRVRNCVKPSHLEPVTHAENLRRRHHSTRKSLNECPRGHPFTMDNTYVRPDGTRRCRACKRAAQAAWKQANKKPTGG